MEAGKIDLKTFCVVVGAIIAIELLMVVTLSADCAHPLVILTGARIIETGLIIVIVVRVGKGAASIGLNPQELMLGLKKGVIWSIGFGVVAAIAFVPAFLLGFNPLHMIQVQLPADLKVVMMYIIVSVFVGPVAEEVFFRGIIYGFFRRWGIIVALVASSLLFMLAHSATRGVPLTQMVGGILFAVAYEVEGSLIVPITIHILGNMAMFIISVIYLMYV